MTCWRLANILIHLISRLPPFPLYSLQYKQPSEKIVSGGRGHHQNKVAVLLDIASLKAFHDCFVQVLRRCIKCVGVTEYPSGGK
jgi:hypothetical protein